MGPVWKLPGICVYLRSSAVKLPLQKETAANRSLFATEVESAFDRLEAVLDEGKASSGGRKVMSDEQEVFSNGEADIAERHKE